MTLEQRSRRDTTGKLIRIMLRILFITKRISLFLLKHIIYLRKRAIRFMKLTIFTKTYYLFTKTDYYFTKTDYSYKNDLEFPCENSHIYSPNHPLIHHFFPSGLNFLPRSGFCWGDSEGSEVTATYTVNNIYICVK